MAGSKSGPERRHGAPEGPGPGDEAQAWAALAELYHRYLTGLLLEA